MKLLSLFCYIVLSSLLVDTYAQKGIDFDRTTSIFRLLKKAETENKYVFIDAFTTWCIPCKQMEQEVFSDTTVGVFMNKNFINVAIQFDKTKMDNDSVKSRYQEVDFFKSYYKVNVYPTYLFVKPNGTLIYKFEGKTKDKSEFIEISKQALRAEEILSILKKDYSSGIVDSVILQKLIVSPLILDRTETIKYIGEYLKKGYLLNQTITPKILSQIKSSDSLFNHLYNKKDIIKKMGFHKEFAALIFDIAFKEQVYPNLKINGKIEEHPGGLVIYKGENNLNVNWLKIQDKLKQRYPDYSAFILSKSKLTYSIFIKNWHRFLEELAYAKTLKSPLNKSNIYLQYANDVYNFCEDKKVTIQFLGSLNEEIRKSKNLDDEDLLIAEKLRKKVGGKVGNK